MVIDDEDDAQVIAGNLLQGCRLLGFDSETTNPGGEGVSLIQLSTPKNVWLFQLSRMKAFPSNLRKLLSQDLPVKVGVGLRSDNTRLEKTYGFRLEGSIDLQHIALGLGQPNVSLDGLCRWVGLSTKQGRHTGNWDSQLSESQIKYAAYDAWVCLEIYSRLFGIRRSDNEVETLPPSFEEREALVCWLEKGLEGAIRQRTPESLARQAENSYGPWRNRWIKQERQRYIEETIRWAMKVGRLSVTAHDELTKVSASTLRSWKQEIEERLGPSLRSMKREAAINMMINSYGGWSKHPISQRREWAISFLEHK